MTTTFTAPGPVETLLAAARRANREHTPVTVETPDGRFVRTYLPRPHSSYFDAPSGTDLRDADCVLSVVIGLLAAGQGDQARAAVDYLDLLHIELDDDQRSAVTIAHRASHLYACCAVHGTHTVPHRGCILR